MAGKKTYEQERKELHKKRLERQGCVRCGQEDGHKTGCLPKGYTYPPGW